MKKSTLFFSTAITAICLTNNAIAQQAKSKRQFQNDGWSVTAGVAPVYSPVFEGASDYGLSIFPDIRVKYGDDFFASVPDGIGYNLINKNGWKAGPIAKIRFGRDEETGGSPFLITGDSDALQGLGEVDTAGELGGFVQYFAHNIRTRAELRQGFGGHEGIVGDLSINYVDNYGPLFYSFGPNATYANSDYINTYFGINNLQSINSGLANYSADSGINSYGISGSATMPINNKVAATLFSSYNRLGNEISNSPLVEERGSPNQFMVGLAFGYRFGL